MEDSFKKFSDSHVLHAEKQSDISSLKNITSFLQRPRDFNNMKLKGSDSIKLNGLYSFID